MLRRLQSKDEQLLREAWTWDDHRPRWWVEMDVVFNPGEVGDLVTQLDDPLKWFIGVFNPELEAVVLVENHGHGQFEGHLMAQRNASVQVIEATISYLLDDLLDFGLVEAFVWVAEKHRSVRKLCGNMLFRPDGFVMYKGAYHGRVIKWLRYSITREQLLMAQAA